MNDNTLLRFPPGFLWGVAGAAYQNEGGNTNNQWAAWEQQPGHIWAGQRAGKATDWWNLETAAADFDRAADLGMNSLRLGVEWSRVEPEPGQFDRSALRHYREMIGLLISRGIKPMVTLHHFTDPLWLTALGAWEGPLIEDYFVRYVTQVVDALGDQVTLWCTINEPIVYAFNGFVVGLFPPGAKDLLRGFRVLRRMLLAHGRAYRAIHRLQNNAQVGLAHNFRVNLPADPRSAADRRMAALLDWSANQSVIGATVHGRLNPPLGVGQLVSYMIDTCDYIGINYYGTTHVTFDPRSSMLFARACYPEGVEMSDMTPQGEPYGEINPHGLYLALKQMAHFGKPIIITENGVPDHDDDVRPRFIATHLAEAWRGLQEGMDLRGYYHWTLVDNFEWAAAWSLRFGLFSLDLDTGARSPNASAAVYGRIAQANGVPRSLLEKLAPGYWEQLEAGS